MQSELQLKTPLDKHDYTQCGVHNSSIPMVVGKNAQPGKLIYFNEYCLKNLLNINQ